MDGASDTGRAHKLDAWRIRRRGRDRVARVRVVSNHVVWRVIAQELCDGKDELEGRRGQELEPKMRV